MSDLQDAWKEVASKAESLGLKLKLHLEQERDEDSDREVGDTKAMLDELSQKLTDAFDSLGNAAKDPAVHADVKDIGNTVRDALMTTLSAAGEEMHARTSRAGESDEHSSNSYDEHAGDEADGDDA